MPNVMEETVSLSALLAAHLLLASSLAYFLTLKMEVIVSFKTSGFFQIPQH
jgi:hypothetical protein